MFDWVLNTPLMTALHLSLAERYETPKLGALKQPINYTAI